MAALDRFYCNQIVYLLLCVFQAQFTEKKNVDKYSVPSNFQILSEIGEATSAILDKTVSFLDI